VKAPATAEATSRPAYYAKGRGDGGWRDWWTLLHPPYTAWHLSYVAIGAALARPLDLDRLGWSLLGFFFGLGVAAHALDELRGRPLGTGISTPLLVVVAALALAGGCVDGWLVGGVRLVPFMVVGASLALAYNLEWLRGMLHNGPTFAFAWGSFPLLTGYYVQHWRISISAVLAAAAAFGCSWVQRTLSTPARFLRRQAAHVEGTITLHDATEVAIRSQGLLAPLEKALRALSWTFVLLAVAMVLANR